MVAPASRAKAMERAYFMGVSFLVGVTCAWVSGVAAARHQQRCRGQGGPGGQGHQHRAARILFHIVGGGAAVGIDLLAQMFSGAGGVGVVWVARPLCFAARSWMDGSTSRRSPSTAYSARSSV